jgi:2-polyprenyl-3-methyl-5-hydroxy-6-metoxy-1,4-benzoquinol methylase
MRILTYSRHMLRSRRMVRADPAGIAMEPSAVSTAVERLLEERPGWPYVDKNDPWSSHATIRDWLSALEPGTRILDVGAATGILARMLPKGRFVISGLEPNPHWATLAGEHYANFHCGTLDETPDEFLRGHDVVVCADVIEHLPDPESALRRLLGLQGPGAQLVVSVPNIANAWVRANLLFGRFDYAERGILDRTHLRFFTRSTFVSLLQSVGLTVEELRATPIPLDLVHPVFYRNRAGRGAHQALALATRLAPTLLGYQLAARARCR